MGMFIFPFAEMFLRHPMLQLNCYDLVVAQFPEPMGRVPLSACLFDAPLKLALVQRDLHAYDFGRVDEAARSIPRFLCYGVLDGFVLATSLGVGEVADTNQAVAVLLQQAFRAGLAGLQSLALEYGFCSGKKSLRYVFGTA